MNVVREDSDTSTSSRRKRQATQPTAVFFVEIADGPDEDPATSTPVDLGQCKILTLPR